MDVVVVRWPEEAGRLEQLARQAVPRLLLVAPDAPPPEESDCVADWIRLPAGDADVRARILALERRAARHVGAPESDGRGRLFYRGRWVSLSPLEESLAHTFVERFGEVVESGDLIRGAWPEGKPGSSTALRIHLLRLRRRLAPLGLEISNVRDRGYVLQERVAPSGEP